MRNLMLLLCVMISTPAALAGEVKPSPVVEPGTCQEAPKRALGHVAHFPAPRRSFHPYTLVWGKWRFDCRPYQNKAELPAFEEGVASWYGPGFHRKVAANRKRFDMNQVSIAHKTWPLGTWVRVTNLENGTWLVAQVTDRGPYVPGRVADLSRHAAQLLDFEEKGTAQVRLEPDL